MYGTVDVSRRIIIFPKGNNTEHLSIYLDVADSEMLPSGWSRNARFKLILVDQNNYGTSRIRGMLIVTLIISGFFCLLLESDFELCIYLSPLSCLVRI